MPDIGNADHRYPQAFSAATRAHELDPSNAKPLYRLALAQRGMNEPQSALKTLSTAPQVPEVQTLSAEIKNDIEVAQLKTDPGSRAGLQSLREGFLRREGADGSTRSGEQQKAERARVWAGEDARERQQESAKEREARDAALRKQEKEKEREDRETATEGWAKEQRERSSVGSVEAMDVDTPPAANAAPAPFAPPAAPASFAPPAASAPAPAPQAASTAPAPTTATPAASATMGEMPVAQPNSFAALKAAKAARRSYADGGAGMPGLVPVSTRRTSGDVAQPEPQPRLVLTAPTSGVPSGVASPAPPAPVPAAVTQPVQPVQPAPPVQPTPAQPVPPAQSTPAEPVQPAQRSFTPPSNPHSTAAGSGLSLVRTLGTLSPQDRFTYLRHYSPAVIAKLMDGLLDPDALGLILRALDAGKGTGNDDWIKQVIAGLKSNKRWRMTELMLPKSDREALARLSA